MLNEVSLAVREGEAMGAARRKLTGLGCLEAGGPGRGAVQPAGAGPALGRGLHLLACLDRDGFERLAQLAQPIIFAFSRVTAAEL